MERTELHERIIEEAKLLPPGELARLLEYIKETRHAPKYCLTGEDRALIMKL